MRDEAESQKKSESPESPSGGYGKRFRLKQKIGDRSAHPSKERSDPDLDAKEKQPASSERERGGTGGHGQ